MTHFVQATPVNGFAADVEIIEETDVVAFGEDLLYIVLKFHAFHVVEVGFCAEAGAEHAVKHHTFADIASGFPEIPFIDRLYARQYHLPCGIVCIYYRNSHSLVTY